MVIIKKKGYRVTRIKLNYQYLALLRTGHKIVIIEKKKAIELLLRKFSIIVC